MDKLNKALLITAESVSREKNLKKEDVILALADGLATAIRRDFPEGSNICIEIDSQTGNVQAFRTFELTDSIENVEGQMLFNEVEDETVVDGYVYEPIKFELNRQKFNITKQVALQKIKQVVQTKQIEELLGRSLPPFSATVKFLRKDSFILDIQGIEIVMPRSEISHKDFLRVSNVIEVSIIKDQRGNYIASRISDDFVESVFHKHVQQIQSGEVEFLGYAREPGQLTIVVLGGKDDFVDPVKACIGYKGQNIKSIQQALGGDHIRLVNYKTNNLETIIDLLKTYEIKSVIDDEDANRLEICISDDYFEDLTEKPNTLTAELLSSLFSKEVVLLPESKWDSMRVNENEKTIFQLAYAFGMDMALILNENEIQSIEEVLFYDINFLVGENILTQDELDGLRKSAQEFLDSPAKVQNLANKSAMIELGIPVSSLPALDANEVYTVEDVADLSVFDFEEILGEDTELTHEDLSSIIMSARNK